ncbi:MAG: hypothetical protein ACK5LT_05540 [Lachnospirales bacterium]
MEPLCTVYKTDFTFENEEALFDYRGYLRALLRKDHNRLLITSNTLRPQEGIIKYEGIEYNILNDEYKASEWMDPPIQIGAADYSKDVKSIYTISALEGRRGIAKLDFENNINTMLFDQNESFINNMRYFK